MMKNKSDVYKKYLEEVHNRILIPDDIFAEVVKETTGAYPVSKEKVLKGESNQVFDVKTEDDLDVIVRVSSSLESFQKEKFVMDKCRKVGVPVAEIFGIKDVKVGDNDYSICVLKKVEGDTLERGEIKMEEFDQETRIDILRQAGHILFVINSIDIEGFGWIHKDGKGNFKTFGELMLEHTDQWDTYENLARRNNFDLALMERAVNTLKDNSDKYNGVVSKLNHGDYAFKHLMFKDGKIVAVLDFGEANGNSPMYDLARWHYWGRDDKEYEWLKEGYDNKKIFRDNYDEMEHLIKINFGLGIFWWYDHEKYLLGVERAKQKLTEDMEFFK